MLRVKVEIVPFGKEEGAHQIHEINIGNMGDNPDGTYLYHAWVDVDPRTKERPAPHAIVNHVRSDGALVLVHKVLEKIHGAGD